MTMQLTDILQSTCVRVPLQATDKQGAIFELVDLLAEQGQITDAENAREAVWQREATRTTGIGHGLAIPHGKTNACSGLVMAIGKPAEPIDFQSIDGKPVDVIILLVSPVDQTGPHIQALATVSRMMTNPDTRAAIRDARNGDELFALIRAQDQITAANQ